ncbi:MAG: glycosyltransferase [Caldilineaceae bacterium]|nr:glycosyltransferase [Caldilineaceae bacterium]
MQILFTVHKYPPESLGGTEIYTVTLARALAAAGHDITVFCPSPAVAKVTIVHG